MSSNNRRVRLSAAGLVFALAIASALPAAAQSCPAAAATIHIDNFGRINANYYRGAQPEGQDYADLAALGIKAVIDLTDDDGSPAEAAAVKNVGMAFFHIPMNTHRPPSRDELAQFLTIVDNPANQPVYVHCVGGRHRTGVMTAVYRMTQDNWTADKAFAEMKQYKYGADFLHPEFKKFVYGFQADSALAAAAPARAAAVAETRGVK